MADIKTRARDNARWFDPDSYNTMWNGRAEAAAALQNGARWVCDIGCGMQALKAFLKDAIYLPADLNRWTDDTETCDLNAGIYPERALKRAELCYLLGVVEYLYHPEKAIGHIALKADRLVVTYNPVDLIDPDRTQNPAWQNAYSTDSFVTMIESCGFRINSVDPVGETQIIVSASSQKVSPMQKGRRLLARLWRPS